MMEQEYTTIAIHLLGALIAGGLIGSERSFHGRPAWLSDPHARVRDLKPVDVSHGVSVAVVARGAPRYGENGPHTDGPRDHDGDRFSGAGVIYKEGATVRGLTTAASIWLTAAIGILFGIGFYFPALLATALAVGILAAFRWLEARMPAQVYAYHHIRFHRDNTMPEEELRGLLSHHGFSIANMAYRVLEDGQFFEYRMVMRTTDPTNTSRLADALRKLDLVREFRIAPTGD